MDVLVKASSSSLDTQTYVRPIEKPEKNRYNEGREDYSNI
jgi:hypothetical protein